MPEESRGKNGDGRGGSNKQVVASSAGHEGQDLKPALQIDDGGGGVGAGAAHTVAKTNSIDKPFQRLGFARGVNLAYTLLVWVQEPVATLSKWIRSLQDSDLTFC